MALLGVGTAQFGLDYGISNAAGKTPDGELERILSFLAARGVELFDTAPAYGDSEVRLGRLLAANPGYQKQARMVSKTPYVNNSVIGPSEVEELLEACEQSLQRFRRSSLYGLLIHNVEDLRKPGAERLCRVLADLQWRGYVSKVGVSVYNGEQIDLALSMMKPDLVQIPFNVLDRRLLDSGHLERLRAQGIEVHARSLFLQGLLLMEASQRPSYFAPYARRLDAFQARAREMGLSPLAAALAPVLCREDIDIAIVGACSLEQWQQLLEAAAEKVDADIFTDLACDDPHLLNPSKWKI